MGSLAHALVGVTGVAFSTALTLGLVTDPLRRWRASEFERVVPIVEPAAPADPATEMSEPVEVCIIGEARKARDVRPERSLKAKVGTRERVYRVTAYCDRGITASGVPSGSGQCAAPAGIPFGSKVHIPALGRTFVVTDRTHRRFRHNTVDIFIPSESDCLEFGRSYLKCEITPPSGKPGRRR